MTIHGAETPKTSTKVKAKKGKVEKVKDGTVVVRANDTTREPTTTSLIVEGGRDIFGFA